MAEFRQLDFERGMTDNYVNGDPAAGELYDNLNISGNKKPYSRPGSALYDATNGLDILPTGNQRIQHLKLHEGTLFEFSGDAIYHRDVTFDELVGPVDSNPAFPGAVSTTAHNASDTWQKHLYVSSDNYVRPKKIYTNEDDEIVMVNASLPSPKDLRAKTTLLALLTGLKTTYNAHVADLAEHASADASLTFSAPDTVEEFAEAILEFITKYSAHNEDAHAGTPVFHAPGSANYYTLFSKDPPKTFQEMIPVLNDIQDKYNLHDADATAHTTGGLHQDLNNPASTDVGFTPSANDSKNYIYGFCYKYTYQLGDTIYIDRSDLIQQLNTSSCDFTGSFNQITSIPILTNAFFDTSESWDTATIVTEIYRTTHNGQVLYKVTEIPCSQGAYSDIMTDADLLAIGETVYTDGGLLEHEEVPPCKWLLQANDVFYYLAVKEGADEKPYRLRHSIQFIPGASPADFVVDFDDDITGGSSVGINPIIFTEDKTYRLEGTVANDGTGFIKKRIVSDTVGCISHNSIVRVQDGLYFASRDGFYFCDGFRIQKISDHLDYRYSLLVVDPDVWTNIYGVYSPESKLVFWAVKFNDSSADNDMLWVHDTTWPVIQGEGVFTTWSYDAGDNGLPSALEIEDGALIRADARGYTFLHDDDLTEDPIVDINENTEDWYTKAVIYDYISSAFSFGSEFQRKWMTYLVTVLKSLSNISVQPYSINDDSGASKALTLIRNSTVFEWGDPFFTWGSAGCAWNAPATFVSKRHFPRNSLRCTLKQIRYTNGYTIITNSDIQGAVTVDATANTATLASGTFLTDPTNFEIFFGDEVEGHLIESATSNTITITDPLSTLVDGSNSDWVIKGYRHAEKFYLEGFTIIYEGFGQSLTNFRHGDLGENAA